MSDQWSGQSPFVNAQVPLSPPPKPPLRKRRWAQFTAACLLSFAFGSATTGNGDAEPMSSAQLNSMVDQKVAAKLSRDRSGAASNLNQAKDRAAADVRHERDQSAKALAAANRRAKSAQRLAVAKAVAKTRSEMQVKVDKAKAAQPRPLVSKPAVSTDPRFDFCYNANDAGYGPYRQGTDPEYDWYQDRDGDGIVCEP